jgi:hypothetical protein
MEATIMVEEEVEVAEVEEVVEVVTRSFIRVTSSVTIVNSMVTLLMNAMVRRKSQIMMQNLPSKKMKKHC